MILLNMSITRYKNDILVDYKDGYKNVSVILHDGLAVQNINFLNSEVSLNIYIQ